MKLSVASVSLGGAMGALLGLGLWAAACTTANRGAFEHQLEQFGTVLGSVEQRMKMGRPSLEVCAEVDRLERGVEALVAESIPKPWKEKEQLLSLQLRKLQQATKELAEWCSVGSAVEIRQAFEVVSDQYRSLVVLIDTQDDSSAPAAVPEAQRRELPRQ